MFFHLEIWERIRILVVGIFENDTKNASESVKAPEKRKVKNEKIPLTNETGL